jgi:hypothetical protein
MDVTTVEGARQRAADGLRIRGRRPGVPVAWGSAEWPNLYFVLDDYGNGEGPIKVGVAHDVQRRVRQLRKECIGKPKLLGVVDHGGRELENSILNEFAEFRLRGEWLYPCPALLKRIRDLIAP